MRFDVALSIGGQVRDTTLTGHHDEPSREEPAVDVPGEVGIETIETLPIETDGGGIDFNGQVTHDVPLWSTLFVRADINRGSRHRHR